MKKILLLFYFLFSSFWIFSQSGFITGKIMDEKNTPLPGAHISIEHPWGEQVASSISENDGAFQIKDVPVGGYRIKITFLGMEEWSKEISFSGEDLQLGDIQLRESTAKLNEVVVEGKAPIATQQGDTTSYNASSFKTLPDASAEELVEKMPGVIIENGEVQAQGERVEKVLVDGRPFFGNDPSAALKNLPAEVISKIEVFDQKSDQAQFTGFDDGETTKTMNIVTKTNMRNGQFGKAQVGYGYEDKYRAGGNFSIFNGDQRISFIGQSNNINIQNFSTEDLLGVVGSGGNRRRGGRGGGRGRGRRGGGGSVNDFLVQQQGGIATTHAIGLNYSDKIGEKLDLTGSYFFNNSENTAEENLFRQFIDDEMVNETYEENSLSTTDNFNHRANFRIDYKINKNNSIIMRPRASWQTNKGQESVFGSTLLNTDPVNRTNFNTSTDLDGLNFSNNILFRHRFPKRGRTLSFNVGMGYDNRQGESFLDAREDYFEAMPFSDTLDQVSNLDVNGWNVSTNLSYTEPLGKGHSVMIEYRTRYQEEDSDKTTMDFSPITQDYTVPNNLLTNVFSNSYQTHTGGVGYNFRKGKFFFITRARLEFAHLAGDESFPNPSNTISKDFVNFVPFAMIRFNKSRQENFRLFYRSNATAPQVEQLQSVLDNSNPLQISIGNADLDQSVSHRFFARYQKTNTAKSRVFFILLGGSFQQDYIGNSLYLEETNNPLFDAISLDPGAQISQPVNLTGYWDARSFITYGIPLSLIKSNLNFDFSANYSNTPGLINDRKNISQNSTFRVGIVLSSNVSETVDFTISSRTGFTNTTNTIRLGTDDRFINQATKVKFNWIIGERLVFRTDLNHQLFSGLSDAFNQNFWLWNMSIGRKIFKNKLGEISISAFDLLKQNNAIQRNITEVYIEDVRTQPLTRSF
ncbi:MAG: outer membrane beta-barrel protein [Bacteroidota bacterium]